MFVLLLLILLFSTCEISHSASDRIPHGHRGLIPPFSGKQISYSLSKKQSDLLDAGKPVVDSNKATGRGMVIQDVDAPPALAMKIIMDMKNYDKYVPQVKKVHIYSEKTLSNSTVLYGARFDTAALGMGFRYWLALKHEPKYNTFTWTLDYNYNSDFDDNVGHWQVMEHPTKKGWTRVLYSCQLRLFAWIPDFIVKYLVKTALVESTTWVTKYSEMEAKKLSPDERSNYKKATGVQGCYVRDGNGFWYYVNYKGGRCPSGPKPKVVKSRSNAGGGGSGSSVGEMWALLVAVLSLVVSVSPHFELQRRRREK